MTTHLPHTPAPPPGLLDNTQIKTTAQSRYIAHAAVGCNNVGEAALWYAQVLGAQPVRILDDRVTFSVGGVLQLVCHLEKRAIARNPRAYPQHFGLTFLQMDDFNRRSVTDIASRFGDRSAAKFASPPDEGVF